MEEKIRVHCFKTGNGVGCNQYRNVRTEHEVLCVPLRSAELLDLR
jgi:hypothetical protein